MLTKGEVPSRADVKKQVRELAERCTAHAQADGRRAIGQLATTLFPLFVIVALMFAFVRDHMWLTLLMALPAAGLVVRLFVNEHDCGHDSFFAMRASNDLCGRCLSLFTLTPYGLWKREHAQHHASSGNLDRRGIGDITTMTVKEYGDLPVSKRLGYRIYRNPLFLFAFGIPFYFLVLQRLPWWHGLPARQAWKSVLILDLALVAAYGALAYVFGFANLLLVAVPIVVMAAAAGGWMLFIQHQFDGVYWARDRDWDFQSAAVLGSSYYALPVIINWFTGHIGLHHIHHLNSRIPNYRLQECLKAIPEFKSLNRLMLLDSLKCIRLKLWDENSHSLVEFGDVR
jgi:omega-6 fatty acid desaturase (delta-12 desaturase)